MSIPFSNRIVASRHGVPDEGSAQEIRFHEVFVPRIVISCIDPRYESYLMRGFTMKTGVSKRALRRSRDGRSGAAIVEFAIVCPMLFLVVFGMIDVGRALMVQNLLTNAARDGARTAALDGATAAEVESAVSEYLNSMSVNGATVTVTPNPLSTAVLGDPVTVTVTVPFNSVSWLPSSMYFGGVNLESTVVMRREVYIDPPSDAL